ncbi:MAG: tail tube protein [Bacteriophage sp.]|nr:MAG: tail tube protein [Bacteriophage sp.]
MAKKQYQKPKREIKLKKTPIILNDEEMFLSYNMLALERLETLGINIMEIDTTRIPLSLLASIVYCGLISYDPTITRDEVAMMIDPSNINYVAEKIGEALGNDIDGDMEEEEGKN